MNTVTAKQFDELMSDFGPFEARPHVAVGVSGGADSMALAVLLRDWVETFEGQVTALIVDHGLRAESEDEAALTKNRLAALGIGAVVLKWSPESPATRIQERARKARYGLMERWCDEHAVLHLAVAHHADDQAETFLMRLDKGSGPDGLAAMPPVRALRYCRLIRPLLPVPRHLVCGYLRARKIKWIEDTSNSDLRFERTRVRQRIKRGQIDVEQVAASANRFRRARLALEHETSRWLALNAQVSPYGYLTLDADQLSDVQDDIRLRVLARGLSAIGGSAYSPSAASMDRLWSDLSAGKTRTLGGSCVVSERSGIRIYREQRNLPRTCVFRPGLHRWDDRFDVRVPETIGPVVISPLGNALKALVYQPSGVPSRALRTVPVLDHGEHKELLHSKIEDITMVTRSFRPITPLYGMGFSVA